MLSGLVMASGMSVITFQFWYPLRLRGGCGPKERVGRMPFVFLMVCCVYSIGSVTSYLSH
jgi:hypothetical protein